MNNLSSNIPQLQLDYEIFSPAAIKLSSDQIVQAVELSHEIFHVSRKWQTYINGLALFAFEEWLKERVDNFTIKREKCTVLQPALANVIPVVANLQVGEFKICLIPTGSLDDSEIEIPQVIVDLQEYIPHFYVLVEVLEEQSSAIISGFLSYQELMENRTKTNLQPEADWTYQLPLHWFDSDVNHLLLYLRCLATEAIALPAIPENRAQILSTMQNNLTALLPQLQSSQRELWEVLTWEQGTAVLTNPELLRWIYNCQQQTPNFALTSNLKDLFKLCTQPALNVGRWLWDELDELAQELSWTLLPSFTPAVAMRSPTEEFEEIIHQLQHRGLEIPSQARGAYQDLLLAGIPLRLYAVTWHLLSESDSHLWTLLLVLGTTSQNTLPSHLKLRVSDQTSVLLEQGINQEQGDSYLFTRVVGNWDEKFLVSVSLMDGVEISLLPFTFYPGQSL
ncbi:MULTISPECIES: DUF1822 family protein [unclassified Nodularia (in: cyanobacteria)]|uniref:DUF1822 family protein n=1 Tax=unclassified Nodularia (in: cyanobacteria) TaxID=2656917 RepID=UPI0018830C89|nr:MULTISPECIES: DUF1822 family protein [unclassified Nodularia (in: cyanobacteria)]MBE9198881.1 DUF1822 family protein [Nodularia sp. LEGE 06071]MCC2692659.1 DUF1822 family protein [Nodularia sp. LEGE 04288]